MNKQTIYIWAIFAFIVAIFWYVIIPKINYNNFLIQQQTEKAKRENEKNIKLQKEIILFVKSYNYKERFNLNLYKNYFVINWNFCDINDSFFLQIEEELKSKNIIYKPKLDINENLAISWYKNSWIQININNLKSNICSFVQSDKNIDYIEVELENYQYSKEEIEDIQQYTLAWTYTINKYYNTPIESITNSQNLIKKISYEFIYPNETISILESLFKDWGKDLLSSNILQDWEIVKWIGWGSCLASTIIYRTLLNAWIDIKSQKTHNIYYENIYWTWEIWLDSTIYKDEKYFVDLIFQNNYNNNIMFIPTFQNNKITLNIYSKEKEYNTTLTPTELNDIWKISWKYEVFDQANNKISEQKLVSKYDKIDSF